MKLEQEGGGPIHFSEVLGLALDGNLVSVNADFGNGNKISCCLKVDAIDCLIIYERQKVVSQGNAQYLLQRALDNFNNGF